jgi:DNA segregation ATPase FtsK/SpoIIIE-like protein
VVRYRARLREGANVAQVERAAPDIQRDMDWPSEPFIENGPRYVAIDAPRAERETLPWSFARAAALRGLEVPVGLSVERELVTLDLAGAPHLLVAGSTGSGKTVFLQGLVLSLLERLPAPACEVVVVDPKAVDFASFEGLGLARPVVTDAAAAVSLLQHLADVEMPARTRRLRELRITDRKEVPESAPSMPALVVVIDEFADLVASVKNDREAKAALFDSVQRLLQRARNVGIHLVLATQRPSVDALPGMLKVNLPVRIAFKLPDGVNSKIVLDAPGAERLLGRGDLLLQRDSALRRAQGFQVTRDDIEAARQQGRP